ncbi:MAG: peptidylprolyl isomerase [Bacteroidetes bacterium]|nr:MAG: peptidylprolyl isomerase [Bacteroidota bacterium]RLD87393.1 MAG: peptidylprolyl isomerase [Bacteroidota bacterium]
MNNLLIMERPGERRDGFVRIALILAFVISWSSTIMAQQDNEYIIDEVVAVVGKNIVLESDIETQYLTYRMQGGISGNASDLRCAILEDILYQKLMISQAEVDSIEISDAQVDAELDRRLGVFINQFGSQDKLEEYYNKTLYEIKQELYEIVKDQLITQQVQSGIVQNVTVTPSEIRSFYRSIPTDSIPLIKTEYVIAEIVKEPPVNVEEKIRVKEQLLDLRRRILKGESFSTMAILYSQDPGSAKKGGELGFYGRGQLYPQFEAVAYKLNEGEISNIVETEAGYHIIQMIERKGDYINVRHILLTPKVSPEDLMEARNELDSVARLIRADSITFEEAVVRFSDADNKNSGGLLINPYTGGTSFEAEQLDAQVSFTIEKMEVDEISNPVPMKTEDQKDAYRLLKLVKRTAPHRANLKDDYSKIQDWAMQDKQKRIVDEWINNKAAKTYIRIVDRYKKCEFANDWHAR